MLYFLQCKQPTVIVSIKMSQASGSILQYKGAATFKISLTTGCTNGSYMREVIFLTVSSLLSYEAVYLYRRIYLRMMSFRKSIIWIPPTSKELWDTTCIYLTQYT